MHRYLKYALLSGLVPLSWFLVWTTLGGLWAPQYNAFSQHASELLASDGFPSISLKIAAIGSGLAFVVFGVSLWLHSRLIIAFGSLAWILFGLAMTSNGIWPMGTPMHGLYALGLANLVAPALSHLEIAPRLQSRGLYHLTAIVSLSGIFYLWLNLTGNDPQALRGFTQRLFSSICSLWPFVVGLILFRNDLNSLPNSSKD